MYETRRHALLPPRVFARRMARHAIFVLALLAGSIFIGMWGYEYFEHLAWRDAFLNSAMLLGGMGPVDPLKTDDGKLFAGFFALYAGIVFLFSAGLLIAPIAHRILHRFHWESGKDKE
ncbi:MAG TPA: hypothetical protein VGO53_15795 [Steroidobacteraceae bacterium]|jgi:hypothetical protein|nr:hypothetical protein [Steroidobacteraceae bacterium]